MYYICLEIQNLTKALLSPKKNKLIKLIKALNRVYPWSLVYNDLPTEAGWYGWAPVQCLSNFNKQGKLLALICTYTMYKSLGYETLYR